MYSRIERDKKNIDEKKKKQHRYLLREKKYHIIYMKSFDTFCCYFYLKYVYIVSEHAIPSKSE